ncbi:unnamed protein product [Meloidogyne enterolobii]|uniref:Uncharacterized protein n=1 Tax=Meloidogyne enterolobii TaxID=390850 RepID=A0ACB0YYS4_MELEN
MDKTIQKLNSEHKNEMKGIKQDLNLKDEKINSLELEIKKANDLTDKKIDDLFNFNNLNSVVSLVNNMVFVKIKNKWKEIGSVWKCCENDCINTNKPIGTCTKGNGFANIINDENIKYFVGNGGYDRDVVVYAENPFKKPQNCFNYSLYYFEVKCKFEKELNGSSLYMTIGLRNCSTSNYIRYSARDGEIYNRESLQLPTFSWNNNDIFGCGLVYPPINMLNEFSYVFFTQNGKQIGKGVLLKDNFDSYKPFVYLKCCSVEANFGNDLEAKPFKYDISEHLILKEFF